MVAVNTHSVTHTQHILSQPTQALDVKRVLDEQMSVSVSNISKQDKLFILAKNEQELQAMKERNEAKRLELMAMYVKQE